MNIFPVNKFLTLEKPNLSVQSTSPLKSNFRQRIIPNKCIHVKRSLVGKGKVFVNVNEEILAHEIIGKSMLSEGFAIINIARKLGIVPQEGLKYLKRSVGENIYKGELLAFKKGLLGKKFITSPTDGLVENYDPKKGELRIQFLPKEIPLTAGVAGIVDDVNYEIGEVTIKSMVTEVYGVLGSGKERSGTLDVIGGQSGLVQPSAITEEMRQHIVVAGGLIYGEALRRAAGHGVHGLISGGLNVSNYKAMINSIDPLSRIGSDVGMSIFATEGFGPLPIGDDIFPLLKAFEGKFVLVHGNISRLLLPIVSPDTILSLRKIALPLIKKPDIAPEIEVRNIKLDDKVRIIWPPFMGAIGHIAGIDSSVTKLASGISTYMVIVETLSRKISTPFTNIELVA